MIEPKKLDKKRPVAQRREICAVLCGINGKSDAEFLCVAF